VDKEMWNLFLRTGRVETYLLFKKIENEHRELADKTKIVQKPTVSLQTK